MTEFFRINMPYGMYRDENGRWMVFNREYLPLGYTEGTGVPSGDFSHLPIWTKYRGGDLTKYIESFMAGEPHLIFRNEKSEINKFILYDNLSKPVLSGSMDSVEWVSYVNKLKMLNKLQITGVDLEGYHQ